MAGLHSRRPTSTVEDRAVGRCPAQQQHDMREPVRAPGLGLPDSTWSAVHPVVLSGTRMWQQATQVAPGPAWVCTSEPLPYEPAIHCSWEVRFVAGTDGSGFVGIVAAPSGSPPRLTTCDDRFYGWNSGGNRVEYVFSGRAPGPSLRSLRDGDRVTLCLERDARTADRTLSISVTSVTSTNAATTTTTTKRTLHQISLPSPSLVRDKSVWFACAELCSQAAKLELSEIRQGLPAVV